MNHRERRKRRVTVLRYFRLDCKRESNDDDAISGTRERRFGFYGG